MLGIHNEPSRLVQNTKHTASKHHHASPEMSHYVIDGYLMAIQCVDLHRLHSQSGPAVPIHWSQHGRMALQGLGRNLIVLWTSGSWKSLPNDQKTLGSRHGVSKLMAFCMHLQYVYTIIYIYRYTLVNPDGSLMK